MPAAAAVLVPIISSTIGKVVLSAAVGFGLSLLGRALAPKPKTGDLAAFTSRVAERTRLIRSSVAEREVVLGAFRKSGAITYAEIVDEKFLHLIVSLADKPENVAAALTRISTTYVNGIPVFDDQIDANGNVIAGRFNGNLRIKKYLGTADQQADPDLIGESQNTESPITANFRGRGRGYVYLRARVSNSDVFPTNGIDSVSALLYGIQPLDVRDGENRFTINPALLIRSVMADRRYGFRVATPIFEDGFTAASANNCEEIVNVTNVVQTGTSVSTALDAIFLDGNVLEAQLGDRVTVAGASPDIQPGVAYYAVPVREVAGVEGEKVAIGLAETYADALAFNTVPINNVPAAGTITVTKTGEPRYSLSGPFKSGRDPEDYMTDMKSAMAGDIILAGGFIRILSGRFLAPTVTLTEDDVRGSISVIPRRSAKDRFNTVKGVYADLRNFGEPSPYPAIGDPQLVIDDGNNELITDVDHEYVGRSAQCQRIAEITIKRHRQEISAQFSTTLKAFSLQAGDTCKLTFPTYGWVDKVFEVGSWQETEHNDESGNAVLQGCDLVLVETDASIYDETVDLAVDPAPNTNFRNPADGADPPTNLQLETGNAALSKSGDGTIFPGIVARWDAPLQDPYTRQYDIGWRVADSGGPFSDIRIPAGTSHLINPLASGVNYEVRVRSVNSIGFPSIFVQSARVVVGEKALPPNVASLSIRTTGAGTRIFEWPIFSPPIADVVGYRIKYTTGAWDWDTATTLIGLDVAPPYETVQLPAGQYTFGIKAVDRTGNESAVEALAIADIGDPPNAGVIVNRTEQLLGWPGTKTDCYVTTEQTLENIAAIGQDWNDLPATWDAMADTWGAAVTGRSPFSYETPSIDIGADVRVTPIIAAQGDAAITVTWRFATEAEGAGALPGKAYAALAPALARYVQIKVENPTGDLIDRLQIQIDAESLIDDFDDVNTLTETAAFFTRIGNGHFKIAPRLPMVAISQAEITALQNVGAGYSWELISKASLEAEFKVYNGAGVPADAVVDVQLKGPK